MNNVFKKIIDKKNQEKILICEISGNHSNSYLKVKKLVTEAIKQKVDLIKFQVYTPDTLTLDCKSKEFLVKDKHWRKYNTLYDLFKKSHTPWKWIKSLIKILEKNKVNWFASAFDKKSVDFLEKLKCKAYKIASPEITDINLIEYIAKKNKPIILSTGMSDIKDINLALSIVKKYHKKFAVLKCVSKYPATYQDLNLASLPELKKKLNCVLGFSDHTKDELASIISVFYGAKIVEKHFKLDSDKNSIDNHFSTPISKYADLKEKLNSVDICVGKNNRLFNLTKHQINSRRSLYVSENVKKNSKINLNNVKSIRPGYGLHPRFLKKILGKKFKKNLQKGTALKLQYIK